MTCRPKLSKDASQGLKISIFQEQWFKQYYIIISIILLIKRKKLDRQQFLIGINSELKEAQGMGFESG